MASSRFQWKCKGPDGVTLLSRRQYRNHMLTVSWKAAVFPSAVDEFLRVKLIVYTQGRFPSSRLEDLPAGRAVLQLRKKCHARYAYIDEVKIKDKYSSQSLYRNQFRTMTSTVVGTGFPWKGLMVQQPIKPATALLYPPDYMLVRYYTLILMVLHQRPYKYVQYVKTKLSDWLYSRYGQVGSVTRDSIKPFKNHISGLGPLLLFMVVAIAYHIMPDMICT